jgi:hypothetical protein
MPGIEPTDRMNRALRNEGWKLIERSDRDIGVKSVLSLLFSANLDVKHKTGNTLRVRRFSTHGVGLEKNKFKWAQSELL